jgi:hypothetical protein
MFPFGSLLSNIPLVVLATAYLFYVGAAAINRTRPSDEPSSSSGNVSVISEPAAKIRQANLFYFHQDKKADDEIQAEEPAKEQWDFYSSLKFTPVNLPEKELQSSFCGNDIFSRPPPLKA